VQGPTQTGLTPAQILAQAGLQVNINSVMWMLNWAYFAFIGHWQIWEVVFQWRIYITQVNSSSNSPQCEFSVVCSNFLSIQKNHETIFNYSDACVDCMCNFHWSRFI
jgi:hypothetical protein